MIYEYIDFVRQNGYFSVRRQLQNKYWMYETIDARLRNSFYNDPRIASMLEEAERSVQNGEKTSFTAAYSLLDDYFKGFQKP